MEPDKEQQAYAWSERQARQYEVNRIRAAWKSGRTNDPEHPDNVRRRIAEQQSILDEALQP